MWGFRLWLKISELITISTILDTLKTLYCLPCKIEMFFFPSDFDYTDYSAGGKINSLDYILSDIFTIEIHSF